jgi:hypothetical protein
LCLDKFHLPGDGRLASYLREDSLAFRPTSRHLWPWLCRVATVCMRGGVTVQNCANEGPVFHVLRDGRRGGQSPVLRPAERGRRAIRYHIILDTPAGGGYVEAAKVSPTRRITSPRLELRDVYAGTPSRAPRVGCRAGYEASSESCTGDGRSEGRKSLDERREHLPFGGSGFFATKCSNSVTDQTNNHRRGWS